MVLDSDLRGVKRKKHGWLKHRTGVLSDLLLHSKKDIWGGEV